jgi:transcriptional regulator with XRE-family HTH domain
MNSCIVYDRHMNGDFGQWLQSEMDKRGWKQVDLEREADGEISGPQISRILSSSRGYEAGSVRAIAAALHMPQTDVFYAAGLLTENPAEPSLAHPVKADIWRMIDKMSEEQLIGLRMLAEIVLSKGGANVSRIGVSKDR